MVESALPSILVFVAAKAYMFVLNSIYPNPRTLSCPAAAALSISKAFGLERLPFCSTHSVPVHPLTFLGITIRRRHLVEEGTTLVFVCLRLCRKRSDTLLSFGAPGVP